MSSLTAITEKQKAKYAPKKKSSEKYILFLLALPFLALVLLFSYFPLSGWIAAFYDYRPPRNLADCNFVGFKWFISIISNPTQIGEMLRVLRNTFAISGLNILTSVFPLIFAIFLVEIKSKPYKKVVQTLTTLPNFISWVLVYSVAFSLFSVSDGFVNNLFVALGVIQEPINWLGTDDNVWISMTLWSIWKNLGWGSIMYLAAISGIDHELYEAAEVDGAGRFRKIWNITIPSLLPTYFVLLMLSIANFLNNGMDQYFVFQNAVNRSNIEVLDLYVYNIGMGSSNNFSFATAISMLKSLISVSLLFFANGLSKLLRGETIV